jgi:hypothetical protein
MNRIKSIRRLGVVLAGLACMALTSALAVPAAMARVAPPPTDPAVPRSVPVRAHTVVHTIASSGMPGWQITLIAAGAAIVAAALAVCADRLRSGRRWPLRPA